MFNNKFKNHYFLFFLVVTQLYSCLTAGTHGSIKAYEFRVTKNILQNAVEKIIAESPNIHRDTSKNYMIDMTDGKSDTIINNHYNDGQVYLTIQIEGSVSGLKEYTFQYVGNDKDWDTSMNSSLSIAYAYDENGKGGSNEDGGFSSKPLLRKSLTSFFEKNFIDRIKKELGEK